MKSSLSLFKKGLADLKAYINGLVLETNLPAIDDIALVQMPQLINYRDFFVYSQNNRGIKKLHDYKSVIVSMYGLVERYIEALMNDYLKLLQKTVPTYKDIPEPIIKNHIAASFELIKYTEQTRYKGSNSKELIIGRLNACLNDSTNYHLNADAFCQHTANFRSDVITTFFEKVGIQDILNQIIKNKKFIALLQEMEIERLLDFINQAADKNSELTNENSLKVKAFHILNDLADRRNEVAHGLPSESLSHDILLSYMSFLEVFGESIYEVLFCDLLKKELTYYGRSIGHPTDVYQSGTIVCVMSGNTQINKGDYLVGQNTNELISSEILEIQQNGAEIENVPPDISIEVGLRTKGEFKKTHTLRVIERSSKKLF